MRNTISEDSSAQVETILSGVQLDPPPSELFGRCMPSEEPRPSVVPAPLHGFSLLSTRWLYRAAALTLLIVVAGMAVLTFHSTPSSGIAVARMIEESRLDFERTDAIYILTEIDDGPGTPQLEYWEMWSIRGVGHILKASDHISKSDDRTRQEHTYIRALNLVQIRPSGSSTVTLELLRRGNTGKTLALYCDSCKEENNSLSTDSVEFEGRMVNRIEFFDRQGKPVVLLIDTHNNRLVQLQSWLIPLPPDLTESHRVVKTYRYPSLAEAEQKFHEFQFPEDARVVEYSSEQQARMLCMENLRDLAGALLEYSSGHDDMPDLLAALQAWHAYREDMLCCPLALPDRTLQYEFLLGDDAPAKIRDDRSGRKVMFECRLHPGVAIQSYTGGHAMLVTEADE